MSPEHTQHLFDCAPRLYVDRTLPMTQSLMCFGFECGDGWFPILLELSEKLETLIKPQPREFDPYKEIGPARASQVKEKFGTLSFYMTGTVTEEMGALIRQAERSSAVTCDDCGKPGALRKLGYYWLATRCDHDLKRSWEK